MAKAVDWRAYAKQRESLNYYHTVRRYIERHSPGKSILDIGPGGTDIVMTGNFAERTVVNREPLPVDTYPGVEIIIGEWPDVMPRGRRFSVVSCCQVIEHLPDEKIPAFIDAIFSASRHVIISVPYHWPEGLCSYHPQDPVTMAKLIKWTGQEPRMCEVVEDGGLRRIVAEFFGQI